MPASVHINQNNYDREKTYYHYFIENPSDKVIEKHKVFSEVHDCLLYEKYDVFNEKYSKYFNGLSKYEIMFNLEKTFSFTLSSRARSWIAVCPELPEAEEAIFYTRELAERFLDKLTYLATISNEKAGEEMAKQRWIAENTRKSPSALSVTQFFSESLLTDY